jgi:hypothetical protein
MSDGNIVQDFLVESYEDLDRLDRSGIYPSVYRDTTLCSDNSHAPAKTNA